jgi:peptidoglycan/LPS O-acetylase OafA/YrhL
LAAAAFVYSPLAWRDLARDGLAASLYASNIHFAIASQNYFHGGHGESPFLHTWSLGVEEQFYLLWPLIIWFGMRRARNHSSEDRGLRRFRLFLGLLVAASFLLSLFLSNRGTPWAFYSLPTRLWELGTGGLIAACSAPNRLSAQSRRFASWFGLLFLVLGVCRLDGLMPYPGLAALLPVFGTSALLVAGGVSRSRFDLVQGLLATGPSRWLGRVSYAWYLWHWPVIVLLTGVLQESPELQWRIVAAGGALILAQASHVLIENPIRFNARLQRSRSLSLLVGGASVALGLTASMAVLAYGRIRIEEPRLKALIEATGEQPHLEVCRESDCFPAGRAVLVWGDSHAAHWLPGLRRAADELGVRVVARTYGGCPPYTVRVALSGTRRPSRACERFRSETERLIAENSPAAVILGSSMYAKRLLVEDGRLADAEEVHEVWADAVPTLFRELRSRGVAVGVILDNPPIDRDPVECLARTSPPGDVCSLAIERYVELDALA